MKFHVWFTTSNYEPWSLATLDSETEVEKLLNTYAGNPEFEFKVVHGREIKFKPVDIATKYVKA